MDCPVYVLWCKVGKTENENDNPKRVSEMVKVSMTSSEVYFVPEEVRYYSFYLIKPSQTTQGGWREESKVRYCIPIHTLKQCMENTEHVLQIGLIIFLGNRILWGGFLEAIWLKMQVRALLHQKGCRSSSSLQQRSHERAEAAIVWRKEIFPLQMPFQGLPLDPRIAMLLHIRYI